MKLDPSMAKRGSGLNFRLWGGSGTLDIPYEIGKSSCYSSLPPHCSVFSIYYNSLRRHCSGFDVFLAGINEKLAGINNVYAL